MEQNSNSFQHQFLYELLANPANLRRDDAANLHHLVKTYPQSGLLQALLAHANEGVNLTQAAATYTPDLLYKLINEPESFRAVDSAEIYRQAGSIGIKQYDAEGQTENGYETAPEDIAFTAEDEIILDEAPESSADVAAAADTYAPACCRRANRCRRGDNSKARNRNCTC